MAYLTGEQKTGIMQLLESQGNPIVTGGLLNIDMVRPFHAYPTPEKGTVPLETEGYHGFVENPDSSWNIPLGPPSGLPKKWGANPYIYVKDVEKFQPKWTPGATQEGKFNKQLADTIAHEGRHQLFSSNNPRFNKILDMLNTSDLGGVGKKHLEEEFNRYLDLVYSGKDTHMGLSLNDVYQNPLLYKLLQSDRPGQGRFNVDQLTDLFWKMAKKYKKETQPKLGPAGGNLKKKKWNPPQQTGGPPSITQKPKPKWTPPQQTGGDGGVHGGGGRPRPDKPGGFTDPGKGSYGPHKADGGLINYFKYGGYLG